MLHVQKRRLEQAPRNSRKTPCIDSYKAGAVGSWGKLFGCTDQGIPLVMDCCREIEYLPDRDLETVTLWHPKEGWSQTLELSRKVNGYGGSQAFFLCPACGERRRYLYQRGAIFLCRKCAGLNYRSQQETRSGSMYYFRKGMDLVEKHLDTWPGFRLDWFSFCAWIPERPRYMHQITYGKYLRRFAKYQHHHQKRQMEDMAKILRLLK